MPRKMPNGKSWQGSYRDAAGRRHTKVWPTKTAAKAWEEDGKAAVRAGTHRDPRAGRLTVGAWHERWSAARVVAESTAAKNATHWRCHVKPAWEARPLDTIAPMDVQAWIRRMIDAGVGAPTIHGSYNLLSAMLDDAVRAKRIPFSPCESTDLPPIVTHLPRWFTLDEHAAILAELVEPYRTLVDFDCHVGLRWGEIAGLHGNRVDWIRGRVQVVDVLTRYGMREYPKSKKSRREVPLPPHVHEALSRLMHGRDRDGLVFAASQGGFLVESNFRNRVWRPALTRAGVKYAPPHTMRHTSASWLVQAGVDLYRVQALLGHESFATTQRYAHLRPGAHDVVLGAWKSLTVGAFLAHTGTGDEERGRLPGRGNGL